MLGVKDRIDNLMPSCGFFNLANLICISFLFTISSSIRSSHQNLEVTR